MTNDTRRVVFVIEHELPDHGDKHKNFLDELSFINRLELSPWDWNSYCIAEGQDPVRLNISYDGVEEV